MRLLIQHQTRYLYPTPAALGPHLVRLRPTNHAKAKVETYRLRTPTEGELRWLQDPSGNHVARLTFPSGTRLRELDLLVELAVDVRPINPFDFFVDDRCKTFPFTYAPELLGELAPFLDGSHPSVAAGPRVAALLKSLPQKKSDGAAATETVPLVVALNELVSRRIRYVIREEPGIYTPEETLERGQGSCRDSAVLLCAALRSLGLAARFVSGYLVQLTDEGMIPDAPRGVGRDVVDLHAWAEVYLPGGGWIGLDATSGLLCGEGHIPLSCTALPSLAAPVEGTSDTPASEMSFEMRVGRLGHEPRPTTPYEEPVWRALLDGADRGDEALRKAGLRLTSGGEPTFNAREHSELPEWNGAALGDHKWQLGVRLIRELRARLSPGAAVLYRMGKTYPGESLPRWALDLIGRRDGTPLWRGDVPLPGGDPEIVPGAEKSSPRSDEKPTRGAGDAERLAHAIARRLGLTTPPMPAFEDPWRLLQDEAALPIDLDPLAADLDAPEERRRLARVLDRGMGAAVGYVLPLTRRASPRAAAGSGWHGETWAFRRGHLLLVPGDSPIGLRLPLRSLSVVPAPPPVEEPALPPDPRRSEEDLARAEKARAEAADDLSPIGPIRTALCVESRDGLLRVFLPPLPRVSDFIALCSVVDEARAECGVELLLEGYPPPSDPGQLRITVTPDPGVLEVNLPPSPTARAHVAVLEQVFDAALHAGLHSEKYLLDGRMAGSGGGNHLTFGGESALASPFLLRPDLLASLVTFVQHHPSLSYMFTGLFVGPTSQAPRVDEARHDALYELEIALRRAFDTPAWPTPPPWLADQLFRHLLVDVTGNTHRTELCIDKLFDPLTPHGRQGVLELRAFEMPPHVRMASAQMILLRNLIAAFAGDGGAYDQRLARLGQGLHDRFLLPHFLWQDFEEILAFLERRRLPLPAAGYTPFLELRCPVVGTLQAGEVRVELRNAFEPWHVLGEEMTAGGTSRYVDSSMERIQVLVDGFSPERHALLVNGRVLPLRATARAEQFVAGVRFRAWAPPHSLQAHLGIHHPVRLDVMDRWARRSLGACAYHVWHPEGQAFASPPLTRFEAAARRAQRFTVEGPLPWPVEPAQGLAHPDAPVTFDLRRYPGDHPPPAPIDP